MPTFSGISHLLLDIEGTTCPVSYVAEVLFPYAAARLNSFLQEWHLDPDLQPLLLDVRQAWLHDNDPEAVALRQAAQAPSSATALDPGAAASYLGLLIRQDRKLTALKDLQGLIWTAGYASGELVAPLYDDVPPALRRWHQAGVYLAVYSSGSVAAQQLLYGHSNAGDLRGLFSHWYDTKTGAKQDALSYQRIAQAMGTSAAAVLFISDSLAECQAAATTGMAVLFSDRPGNPHHQAGSFEKISDYAELHLKP
jgi:enolase-phosphatase E1